MRKKGATDSQLAIFTRLFPNGANADAAMATAGHPAGLDLGWIVKRFLGNPAPETVQSAKRLPTELQILAIAKLKSARDKAADLEADTAALFASGGTKPGTAVANRLLVEGAKAALAALHAVGDQARAQAFGVVFIGR
jgi:hypothetical protein